MLLFCGFLALTQTSVGAPTGGAAPAGGKPPTGGLTSAGGKPPTGGAAPTGGLTSAGGTLPTGGAVSRRRYVGELQQGVNYLALFCKVILVLPTLLLVPVLLKSIQEYPTGKDPRP